MQFKRITVLYSILLVFVVVGCTQSYKPQSYSGVNVTINNSIEADSLMIKQITPFKQEIDLQMNTVIGFAIKELIAKKPESDLSNLVADITQTKGVSYLQKKNADSLNVLALVNVKGLRVPIQKGEIMVRNIFEVMPFENEIVILELSGDSILSFFNFLATTNGDGLSGAKFEINNKQAQNIRIGEQDFNRDLNYYLVTSDYLANGGDYYNMITAPLSKINTGYKVRDVIIEYIENKTKEGENITASMDGRISYVKN